MIPEPKEDAPESEELKEMRQAAAVAVLDFIAVRNGLAKGSGFCRVTDLPEILGLSSWEDPKG